MDLKKFKLGFGPMSREIIDLLGEYSEHAPLMVIGSRNQVDYQGGYVCDSNYLNKKLSNRKNILLCRDHCGPYFKDTDKQLSLGYAIDECKKTINADINAGFNLIHIDVSKVPTASNMYAVADELIEFTLGLKPDILLEFGSEENTGQNLESTLANIDDQLNYCKKYKDNIKFFVSQTGSLTKGHQAGNFDIEYNLTIADKIHSAGFLFKEHNGDYLTSSDLELRKQSGIDAINIAPQLGVVQTTVLKSIADNGAEWNNFVNVVYNGNRYQRWLDPSQYSDKNEAVRVSGHYFFNTLEYELLLNSIDKDYFYTKLKNDIFNVLNIYKNY